MKLTKAQSKAHQQALDLVHSDRPLTLDERQFILDNYAEAQGQLNTLAGAFFTPTGLARDLSIEVGADDRGIVDLCAGIGALAFKCHRDVPITCVEACEAYVTVGRRVMPDAQWIHADVFKAELGRYSFAISNPPFGAIPAPTFTGRYTGGQFEYKLIELASRIADYGAFILPQTSAPFRYSGQPCFQQDENEKARKFREQTGIVMEPSCGIDTSIYRGDWRGVSPICEVVVCEFAQPTAAANEVQLSLLEAA